MSKNVEIKLVSEGVRELLKSSDMMAVCREEAERIADQYGGDAEISEYVGSNRVNVSVCAPFSEASQDNSFLKAVF